MATTPLPASSMLSVTIHPTNPVTTTIAPVEIPSPSATDLLIHVTYTSSNPKDIKHLLSRGISTNSGDDAVGYIISMGQAAAHKSNFKLGDRIAGMHTMFAPGGTYAEYALIPYWTAFLIPSHVSDEEAVTIPLVTLTAGVSLFRRQNILSPWSPERVSRPSTFPPPPGSNALIVYGATSALGTFTVKLAKLVHMSPIIAIAGSPSPALSYLQSLLGPEDKLLSYRAGPDKMAVDLASALGDLKPWHAIDCISTSETYPHLLPFLDPNNGILSVTSGAETYKQPSSSPSSTPDPRIIYTYVGTVHSGAYLPHMPCQPPSSSSTAAAAQVSRDPAWAETFMLWISEMLAKHKFSGHLREVLPGGLYAVDQGLDRILQGSTGGRKMVYRVGDEREVTPRIKAEERGGVVVKNELD